MRTFLVLCVVLASMLAVCCVGQHPSGCCYPNLRIEPEAPAYDVRIVNTDVRSLRIKIPGFRDEANFRTQLRPGASIKARLYGGERVVCVWSAEGRLERFAFLNVNQSGKLAVQGGRIAQNPFGGPVGDAPPVTRIEPLSIEKEE